MRDDAGSHYFGLGNPQNREPHVNTPMADTMTTNVTVSMNVLEDSSWPGFEIGRESSRGHPLHAPAVLSLETRRSDTLERAAEAHSEKLREVLFRTRTLSQFRALLFVADGPWQPSTAMVKHNKLWKSLAKNWEVSPFTHRSTELEVESDRGIRYAGLLEVGENTVGAAVDLLRLGQASHGIESALVACPRPGPWSEPSIALIFRAAFPPHDGTPQSSIEWVNLAVELAALGCIVGRTTGGFDDPLVATDLFGSEALISALAREARRPNG
jgi:hypothetical protein